MLGKQVFFPKRKDNSQGYTLFYKKRGFEYFIRKGSLLMPKHALKKIS